MTENPTLSGQVTKIYCGYCDVLSGIISYRCKPKGTIKLGDIFVGDYVNFQKTAATEGIISELLPRKNNLSHPHVANISQIIVTVSQKNPEISLEIIDKFLCLAANYCATPILCINKCDLLEKEIITKLKNIYQKSYQLVFTSCLNGEGLEKLTLLLKNQTSLFTGPSGVGKSSLLNAIHPQLNLKIKAVSEKNKHGRHTTRHAELLEIAPGSLVLDTPGFTQMELTFEKENLKNFFPEFEKYSKLCQFNGCLHHQEPNCAVKKAATDQTIPFSRYSSYIKMLTALIEKEKYKYKRGYKKTYRKGTNKK